MPTIVKPISVCAVLLLALSGCSKIAGGQDEMSWARAALDRNDHLQVVASDAQAKTFTVRVKESGKLVVVPLDQVVAGSQEMFEGSTAQAAGGAQSAAGAGPGYSNAAGASGTTGAAGAGGACSGGTSA